MDTSSTTTARSTTPATGTWFSRHMAAYELASGLEYREALTLAETWAADGLEDTSVELEVEVVPAGDEWVVDVVAHERSFPFERLGTRRARIDAHGRLVA